MKSFRFHLQKVLEWRAVQLRSAEERLTQLQQELARVAHRAQVLLAEYRSHEERLIASATLQGSELQALALFRQRTDRLRQALRAEKAKGEALVAEQRQHLLQARSKYRLLEKLREQQLRDWVYRHDREVEDQAAEAYLTNWVRDAAEERTRGVRP